MKKSIAVVTAVLLLVLTGGVGQAGQEQTPSLRICDKVEYGVTTVEQMDVLFGKPLTISPAGDYERRTYALGNLVVVAEIDQNDRVGNYKCAIVPPPLMLWSK